MTSRRGKPTSGQCSVPDCPSCWHTVVVLPTTRTSVPTVFNWMEQRRTYVIRFSRRSVTFGPAPVVAPGAPQLPLDWVATSDPNEATYPRSPRAVGARCFVSCCFTGRQARSTHSVHIQHASVEPARVHTHSGSAQSWHTCSGCPQTIGKAVPCCGLRRGARAAAASTNIHAS